MIFKRNQKEFMKCNCKNNKLKCKNYINNNKRYFGDINDSLKKEINHNTPGLTAYFLNNDKKILDEICKFLF